MAFFSPFGREKLKTKLKGSPCCLASKSDLIKHGKPLYIDEVNLRKPYLVFLSKIDEWPPC